MTASDSLSSKLGTRAWSTPTLQGHKNPGRGFNGLKGPGFHGVRGVFLSLTALSWREAATEIEAAGKADLAKRQQIAAWSERLLARPSLVATKPDK
jgi:hypothetical protein